MAGGLFSLFVLLPVRAADSVLEYVGIHTLFFEAAAVVLVVAAERCRANYNNTFSKSSETAARHFLTCGGQNPRKQTLDCAAGIAWGWWAVAYGWTLCSGPGYVPGGSHRAPWADTNLTAAALLCEPAILPTSLRYANRFVVWLLCVSAAGCLPIALATL